MKISDSDYGRHTLSGWNDCGVPCEDAVCEVIMRLACENTKNGCVEQTDVRYRIGCHRSVDDDCLIRMNFPFQMADISYANDGEKVTNVILSVGNKYWSQDNLSVNYMKYELIKSLERCVMFPVDYKPIDIINYTLNIDSERREELVRSLR